ncbi:unnamed protein product [Taenia asiatica]|uniref:IMS_C domain-containing protein n=1 Tax=Taenia asiatica TaxID=60517 RepID=A0A0R3W6Y7_TAEAS|nr:unnamed protein product [Taenia asiatica]
MSRSTVGTWYRKEMDGSTTFLEAPGKQVSHARRYEVCNSDAKELLAALAAKLQKGIAVQIRVALSLNSTFEAGCEKK